jgi:ADP-ribose pyrophosphatase YjhB (NUDIX family)
VIRKLPLRVYRKVYSLVPRLCVDVIIRLGNGIVLAKRDIPPCKRKWHIPGGTVLFGENLEEAVKRVAKEETNLRVKIKKQLGVKQYSRKSAFGHTISIVYLTEATSGKLKGNKYGKEVKVFKELPQNMIAEQKTLLEKLRL